MQVVDPRIVEPGIVVVVLHQRVEFETHVGQVDGFGHTVCHIEPEAVDAAGKPESQGAREVVEHLRVVPVQIRLLGREDVQVPLAGGSVGLGDPGPGRATEDARPVVRRLRAVVTSSVSKDVAGSLGATAGRRQGRSEPRVLAAGVIGHQIHRDLDVARMSFVDQRVEDLQVAEQGVDVTRIRHVVPVIGHGRPGDGSDPDCVDSQQLQVAELVANSVEVTDAVTVGVRERAGIDLVEDGVLPPQQLGAFDRIGHKGQ